MIAPYLTQLPRMIMKADNLKVLDTLYSNAETVMKFIKINEIRNMSTHAFTIISSTIYISAIVLETGEKFIIAKAVEVRDNAYNIRMNHLKLETR